jgi:hypothetical protein
MKNRLEELRKHAVSAGGSADALENPGDRSVLMENGVQSVDFAGVVKIAIYFG